MDEEERNEIVEDTDADTRDVEERVEEETDRRIDEFRDVVNRIESLSNDIRDFREMMVSRFDAMQGIAIDNAGSGSKELDKIETDDSEDLATADWEDWEKELNN